MVEASSPDTAADMKDLHLKEKYVAGEVKAGTAADLKEVVRCKGLVTPPDHYLQRVLVIFASHRTPP